MEMANAAGAAPKVSSGKVYMLTLKAATAKMLSEIPAEAHAGVGAHGRAAVARKLRSPPGTRGSARPAPERRDRQIAGRASRPGSRRSTQIPAESRRTRQPAGA